MATTEASLNESLEKKYKAIKEQGEFIRSLKTSNAPESEIDEARKVLWGLKTERKELRLQLAAVLSAECNSGMSRETFREAVTNVLEKRRFYIPSFQIYGGVAGLYDYGPPGCKIKKKVIDFWLQHFVDEEDMQTTDTPIILPEVVLKASGHVQKFNDIMVKDEKTGSCYRADHLLQYYCENKLQKDPAISSEDAAELKHILDVLGDLSIEQLGAKIKEYGIVAPDTKNPLSDPYPFNLMFSTTTDTGGLAYLRPETAQAIFCNFLDHYKYNGNKLPFAVAQDGPVFRNEIAPRQKLLRVREFTLAEIEHFFDPMDKSHQRFSEVSNLEFLMLPRDEQVKNQSAKRLCLHDAVTEGIISHQTLAYFIGRVYLFLTSLGIDKERLRFRQHLSTEMAHYASECWDAEIETTYGWIECVGISDRTDFDLRSHSEKGGVSLVAQEKYPQPKEVEKLVIRPNKMVLGPEFKRDHTKVVEALEAMTDEKALEMKDALESDGKFEFEIGDLQKFVTINKNMVWIGVEKKRVHVKRTFIPHVLEPGFGIGRILYCLYEHSFYTRFSKTGMRQNVFRFPPHVAPYACAVFPLFQNKQLGGVVERITESLIKAGIYSESDFTGTSINKKYADAYEVGIPFVVTVESETSVTVNERDSEEQIRVSVDEVSKVVKGLSKGSTTWADVFQKYSANKTNLAPERDSNVDALAEILKDISEGRITWAKISQLYSAHKANLADCVKDPA